MADFCGEAWEDLMTKIQMSHVTSNISDIELDKYFITFQRLLEKKVCVYWHKIYFEIYVENHIVPWGLRIQIFPNIKKTTDPLKKAWEDNLQACSFNMISMLCQEYDKELALLDISINEWLTDRAADVSFPRFVQRDKDLRAHLEGYTIEIINAKENKFLRDKLAHTNGYAYRWDGNVPKKPSTKPSSENAPKNNNEAPNVFSTSFSSSSSTTYRDISQDRIPKKRKSELPTSSTDSIRRTFGITNTTKPLGARPKTTSTSTLLTRALPRPPLTTTRSAHSVPTTTTPAPLALPVTTGRRIEL
ncbi:hypothetical protein AB205_0058670 [Aquarana catesbeiana]|uniref:Uncharacterized protein n=1 Tax=Aquarana catesbeiana TaxID=8400 RepID=A0A2G9R985_AQUCT|nr:hypothetical protein AB205_0058670 [Aquarana catesbeiana]